MLLLPAFWQPSLHRTAHVAAQGLPFCVAGTGDLLALFRCISCRYCFGTNLREPAMLGAPGRVFATTEVPPPPSSATDLHILLRRFGSQPMSGVAAPPHDGHCRVVVAVVATVHSAFVHPMASSPCGACARGAACGDGIGCAPAIRPPPPMPGRQLAQHKPPPPKGPAPRRDGWRVCAQPETSCNVQKYDREIYARSSEAVHCRIHSVLILPLFMEAACRTAVGVLEVVQTVQDMPFARLARTLSAVLRVPLPPAPSPSRGNSSGRGRLWPGGVAGSPMPHMRDPAEPPSSPACYLATSIHLDCARMPSYRVCIPDENKHVPCREA